VSFREHMIRTMVAELGRLEAPGRRMAGRVGLQVRAAVTRLWENGELRRASDPAQLIHRVVSRTMQPIAQTIADAMLLSDLYGRRRAALNAWEWMRKKGVRKASLKMFASTAYEGALDWAKARSDLGPKQLELLAKKYSAQALVVYERAQQSLERRLEQAVLEALRSCAHVRDGKRMIQDAFKSAGYVPGADHTLEAIYRTQVQAAYSAGRWNKLESPEVQEILWGFEYATAGDDRVRPDHARMDGVKRPKNDPIWNVWTPPNGWNCRCLLLEIYGSDTATKVPAVKPDSGFAWNPGTVFKLPDDR